MARVGLSITQDSRFQTKKCRGGGAKEGRRLPKGEVNERVCGLVLSTRQGTDSIQVQAPTTSVSLPPKTVLQQAHPKLQLHCSFQRERQGARCVVSSYLRVGIRVEARAEVQLFFF